jgi:hypothetical protein
MMFLRAILCCMYAAMQLEKIECLNLGGNLEDCMEFIGALALPHVGDKLVRLRLRCVEATTDEQELLEAEVARLIRAGAWPRLVGIGPEHRWPAYISVSLGRKQLHEAVKQALEEKGREIKAACM